MKKLLSEIGVWFDKNEQWIPVCVWASITMATIYVWFLNHSGSRLFEVLSFCFSAGLIWIPGQIRRGLKEGWNNLSIGCLWGLIPYITVNLYYTIKYYSVETLPTDVNVVYIGILQSVALMGATCFALIWLLKFRHRD